MGHKLYILYVFSLALLISIFGSSFAAETEVNNWQGEWGSRVEGEKGTKVGFFSISNCNQSEKSCDVSFGSEDPDTSSYCFPSLGAGKLKILSSNSAQVELNYNSRLCAFELSMTGPPGSPSIEAKLGRSECSQICRGDIYFPQLYSLQSRIKYKGYELRCFTDLKKARQILCQNSKFYEFDKKADKLQFRVDDLSFKKENSQEPNNYWEDRKKVQISWLEKVLSECEYQMDKEKCLTTEYQNKIQLLEKKYDQLKNYFLDEMYKVSPLEDPVQSKKIISELEGVYKYQFKNGNVDGDTFISENILELVSVPTNAMYVRIHLDFYNGHVCNIAGTARVSKNGALIFTKQKLGDFGYCRLQLKLSQEKITLIDDPKFNCSSIHCGARGSYNHIKFYKNKKRTIKYMTRLKNSNQYKSELEDANIPLN